MKTKGLEHCQATDYLSFAFYNYTEFEWRTEGYMFGTRVCRDVVSSGRVWQPDFAIHAKIAPGSMNYSKHPCLVAEIEFERRGLCTAHKYCVEHFKLAPSLNVVLLFKFFSRRPGTRRFAAVAVTYRRTADGPVVADAVSFGMCPPPPSADVPKEIARALRVLPDAPCPCPRDSEATPTLSVPSAALLGPSLAQWVGEPGREGTARVPGPLVVRLWRMLSLVERAYDEKVEPPARTPDPNPGSAAEPAALRPPARRRSKATAGAGGGRASAGKGTRRM